MRMKLFSINPNDNRKLRRDIHLLCHLPPLAPLSTAQQLSGRIDGSVADAQGALVPGAMVVATTSETGSFTLPNVRLGAYAVTTEAAGFRRAVVKDAVVDIGGTASRVIGLEVSRQTEEITVTAETAQAILNMTDLSLPGTAEIPKRIRSLRTRVRADKVDGYMALIKSDLLPAIRNSGLKSYIFARTRHGAPTGEFRSSTPINSRADLDEHSVIVKAMGGEEGYRRYLAKITLLILESEYNVCRLIPALSYIPGGLGATTSGE